MRALLKELRQNPLLWLLVFVPALFVAQTLEPEAHTLLFVLSVLAIVPLAALLSHATESVAAKTGDTVGGLLNATLGNLTELVAKALVLLGSERAWVVHGADGLDELSTTGYTKVSECRDGAVHTFYLHPSDFGVTKAAVLS